MLKAIGDKGGDTAPAAECPATAMDKDHCQRVTLLVKHAFAREGVDRAVGLSPAQFREWMDESPQILTVRVVWLA